MQLSAKGRYAVMALADMAKRAGVAPMPLSDIAQEQALPIDYLEQIFMKLRRAGLVASSRGPGGGYMLGRAASDIRIAEIMAAVDEPVKMTRCKNEAQGGCIGGEKCATHDLWDALGEHIVGFLQSVSLQDVVDKKVRAAPAIEAV